MQNLLDKARQTSSIIKAHLAAISVCNLGFGDKPAGH